MKEFTIPKCLERTPEIYGLSVQSAVIFLGLTLIALIMIAKSIWLSLAIMSISYGNLKLEKKMKKVGGITSYLLLLSSKQKSIRVNCTIESLIEINKNKNGK